MENKEKELILKTDVNGEISLIINNMTGAEALETSIAMIDCLLSQISHDCIVSRTNLVNYFYERLLDKMEEE